MKNVSYLGFTSNDLGRRAVTFQDDFTISCNIQPNYKLILQSFHLYWNLVTNCSNSNFYTPLGQKPKINKIKQHSSSPKIKNKTQHSSSLKTNSIKAHPINLHCPKGNTVFPLTWFSMPVEARSQGIALGANKWELGDEWGPVTPVHP